MLTEKVALDATPVSSSSKCEEKSEFVFDLYVSKQKFVEEQIHDQFVRLVNLV